MLGEAYSSPAVRCVVHGGCCCEIENPGGLLYGLRLVGVAKALGIGEVEMSDWMMLSPLIMKHAYGGVA